MGEKMNEKESLPFMVIWLLLAVIFAISAALYAVRMQLHTFLAEFAVLLLMAIMLRVPSTGTAGIATCASFIWLVNQLVWWYCGGINIEANVAILWATGIINLLLLFAGLFAAALGKMESTMLSVAPTFLMMIYSLWKVYLDFAVYGGLAGNIEPWSGGLWALGIFLVSLCTLIYQVAEPKGTSRTLLVAVAAVGFIISAYAAVSLGHWLAIIS